MDEGMEVVDGDLGFSRGLYPFQSFQHDDAVPSDHHHADVVLLPARRHLHALVDHQVHEGVEAPQDALHVPAAVQLHCGNAGVKGGTVPKTRWFPKRDRLPPNLQLAMSGTRKG